MLWLWLRPLRPPTKRHCQEKEKEQEEQGDAGEAAAAEQAAAEEQEASEPAVTKEAAALLELPPLKELKRRKKGDLPAIADQRGLSSEGMKDDILWAAQTLGLAWLPTQGFLGRLVSAWVDPWACLFTWSSWVKSRPRPRSSRVPNGTQHRHRNYKGPNYGSLYKCFSRQPSCLDLPAPRPGPGSDAQRAFSWGGKFVLHVRDRERGRRIGRRTNRVEQR